MKKIALLSLLAFTINFSNAQEILLDEQVYIDTLPVENGQNGKKFSHMLLKYGVTLGENLAGSNINFVKSYEFGIGYQFKRKLTSFYDMGYTLLYNFNSYSLRQDSLKLLPNQTLHDKENIMTNAIQLQWFNRINIGRRGNMIKTYVDLGLYGGYNLARTHSYKNENFVTNTTSTDVINKGVKYIDNIEYGALVRIGYKRFSLYGKYRASKLIKDSFGYNDVPKFQAGLELGIF